MPEGWTRWTLDRYGIPWENVWDADVRNGALSDYDVVILPAQGEQAIRDGHAPGDMPDRFVGGLGVEGTAALRSFVDDPLRRASWSAVATIIAFANVPIVYFSVKWWRTLHQGFTGARDLEDTMGTAFAFNWFGLALMVTWLIVRRSRLAWLTRPRAVASEDAPAASTLVAGG